MATQPKVNPRLPNVARHFNGKSVTAVTVTLGALADSNFNFGPEGPVQAVYEVLGENATPIIISEIDVSNGSFDVYFEGDFQEVNDYALGDNSFVGDLEARIQALGSVDIGSGDVADSTLNLGAATAAVFGGLVDDTTGTAGLVGDGGVDVS